jgi:hypothetical protein
VDLYTDENQRIFARFGEPPVPLVPLVLDHNLRNTRQIGDVFNPLAPMRMRLMGGDGPEVKFVLCLNQSEPADRKRERLYVGPSRATDQLVVVDDPDVVRQMGGAEVARRLGIS